MEPGIIPNDERAATLLAKYIQAKITNEEEIELNEWIIYEDNYYLFERLTSPANIEWSQNWFAEKGVNTKFLQKPFPIYETKDEKETRKEFYLWSGLLALTMLTYYLIIRFA
jgi:hypothetical protein